MQKLQYYVINIAIITGSIAMNSMELQASQVNHSTSSLSQVISDHNTTGLNHSHPSRSHHVQHLHQAALHTLSNSTSALHLHSSPAETLTATSVHHHSHLAQLQSHQNENQYSQAIQSDTEKNKGICVNFIN